MMTYKSFFLRCTTLFTAILLMFIGIMDYSFASTDDKLNALELGSVFDSANVTDFYVYIKDWNGKGAMIGKKQSAMLDSDGGDSIRAEEVASVSLVFRWKKQHFTAKEIEQLEKSNGLIKCEIGNIEGIDFTSTGIATCEDNAIIANNGDFKAAYWIEDGYVYIRLEEGAYNRFNYVGGFTLDGRLEYDKIAQKQGKLQIDKVTYEFDTSSQLDLFISKTADGTVGKIEGHDDYYYQKFTIVVGSVLGQAENVVLEEYLGEWFDGICHVTISRPDAPTTTKDGFISKTENNPITIDIGTTPDNTNKAWTDYGNAVTVTYHARLNADKAKLLNYQYNGEQGKNTVKATATGLEPKEATAYISVHKPSIEKTGTLSGDGKTITWTITIKTTELSGRNLTFKEYFNGDYSDYIGLTEYHNNTSFTFKDGTLTAPENHSITYDENKGEFYITFTTPVNNLPGENQRVEIKNTAEVTFDDNSDTTIKDSASVELVGPVTPSEKYISKKLVSSDLYDSDLDKAGYYNPDNGIHYNTFYWQVDYTLQESNFTNPDGTGIWEQIPGTYESAEKKAFYFYDKVEADDSSFNSVILRDSIVVKDDHGNEIYYIFGKEYENRNEFTLYIDILKELKEYNSDVSWTLKAGDTLHITYQSVVDKQEPVSKIYNFAAHKYENSKQTDITEDFPTFYTHKYVYHDTQSSDKSCAVEWVINIEEKMHGFYPGDSVEITDYLPAGLKIVKDSVSVGYQWNNPSSSNIEAITDGSSYNAPPLDCKLDYSYIGTADGGRQYTFTFTIPDDWFKYGNTSYKGLNTLWLALKFKTELTSDAYQKVVSGELTEFTNTAKAVVKRDNNSKKTEEDSATFYPDINKGGRLLSKTADMTSERFVQGENIPYTITVNPGMEKLLSGNGKLTLVDTLGKRLTPDTSTITVTKYSKKYPEGTEVEDCWEYSEVLNSLKFTLDDEAKYVISYKATANVPGKDADGKDEAYDPKDFYNTAKLFIESNSISFSEFGTWVKNGNGYVDADSLAKKKNLNLNITKSWEETSDYKHTLTFKITSVKYNADGGVESTKDFELPELTGNSSQHTFTITNLPAMETDSSGNTYYYVYTIKEVGVSGGGTYETVYTPDSYGSLGEDGVVIDCRNLSFDGDTAEVNIGVKNTLTEDNDEPEEDEKGGEVVKTAITINKVWNDGNSNDRPKTITFILEKTTADDKEFKNATQTEKEFPVGTGNTDTYVFEDLVEIDENGISYIYRVTEKTITLTSGDYYDVKYEPNSRIPEDGVIKVTNTLKGTTKVTVQKYWKKDSKTSLPDTFLPEDLSIWVKLDGVEGKEAIELNAENEWKNEWTGLPKYDDKGAEIKYKVVELVGGKDSEDCNKVITIDNKTYDVTYGGSNNALTVTNTLRDATTTKVTVQKYWMKDASTPLPETFLPEDLSVWVKLDGVEDEEAVELNAENEWYAEWTGLPKYDDNGAEIKYEVVELVGGKDSEDCNGVTTIDNKTYDVTYGGSDNALTVTNTLRDATTKVTVEKIWLKDINSALPATFLPSDLSVWVKLDGVEDRDAVELNAGNNWKNEWTGLPKYDDNGAEIKYEVVELDSKGEDCNGVTTIDNKTYDVTYGGSNTELTVTNTLRGTTKVTVQKYWKKDSLTDLPENFLPENLSIWVKLDGFEDEGAVELNAGNEWTATWNNLPKYDEYGELIEYNKVVELDSEGNKCGDTVRIGDNLYTITYGKSDDGTGTLTVTNTLITASIRLEKTDFSGKPLTGATLQLSKVTSNDDNGEVTDKWTSRTYETVSDVIKLANGDYVLEETLAPFGYESASSQFRFTVKDGEITVDESGEWEKEWAHNEDGDVLVITVKNDPTPSFKISKADAETKAGLEGAELSLSINKSGEIIELASWTSSETTPKEFTIAELAAIAAEKGYDLLDIGRDTNNVLHYTFILTETKAPNNYQTPDPSSFYFLVYEDGTVGHYNTAVHSEEGHAVTETSGNTFILYNERPSEDNTEPPPEEEGTTTSSSDDPEPPPEEEGSTTSSSDDPEPPPEEGSTTSSSDDSETPPEDNGTTTTPTGNIETPPEEEGTTTSSSNSTVIPPEEGSTTSSSDDTETPPEDEGTTTSSSNSTETPPEEEGTTTSSSNNTVKPPESEGTTTSSSNNTVTPPIVTEPNATTTRNSTVTPPPEVESATTTPKVEETTTTPKFESTTTTPKVEETTTPPETEEVTTTPPEVEETTTEPEPEPTTTEPPAPGPSFGYYPPAPSDDNFNLDNDGSPSGDMSIQTEDDRFNLNDDGNPQGNLNLPKDDEDDSFNLDDDGYPRGDMNLPTGVVVGGSVGLVVGSLALAALAQSAGKRRRSRKDK